jgi:hypothetical protein
VVNVGDNAEITDMFERQVKLLKLRGRSIPRAFKSPR